MGTRYWGLSNQSLCASWSADYPRYATSSPASSRFPIWRWNRRCWTRSEEHHGKNQKRLICIWPKFVHISRYALKIPGEIVWYEHYRSSSAFKGHNMRCSFEIFLRKGGRNRRLLLASQNCYFLCRRDNFRDRNNAVRINTSFLHVLKVLDLNGSFSLVLFSPQIFFPVHWHVHEGYWSSHRK